MSDRDEQLVRVDAERSPDEYERDYMRGDGLVLYRDKTRSPWPLHVAFAVILGVMIGSAITSPVAWLAATLKVLVVFAVWLLFTVLRVTVSEGHVNIQLGPFGPKIPIAAIESAESVRYSAASFGGWGIRVNLRGEWMYNLPGDGGRAVKIIWRTRRGRRRVTYVASRNADQVTQAIAQAQAALPAAPAPPALSE